MTLYNGRSRAARPLVLLAAAVFPVMMLGQDGARFEVGAFGGGQFWKLKKDPTTRIEDRLTKGGVLGGRLSYDFTERWGVETAVSTYGVNNQGYLLPGNALSRIDFGARNFQWMAGPIYYLRPSTSRFRPFLTAGPGLQYFYPTSAAKNQGNNLRSAGFGLGNVVLDDNFSAALAYGGGVKAWITSRLNARFDLRGIYSGNPRIRLYNDTQSAELRNVPLASSGHGLQALFGLGYALKAPGWGASGDKGALRLRVQGPDRAVYQGDKAKFSVSSDAPAGSSVKYSWRVGGQPAGTGETIEVDTTNRSVGQHLVEVTGSAPGLGTNTGNAVLTVLAPGAPRPDPGKDLRPTVVGPDRDVVQGQKVQFAGWTDVPQNVPVGYSWTIDGQPAGTGQIINVETAERKLGRHPVEVTASSPGWNSGTGLSTLRIRKRQKNEPLLNITAPDKAVYQGDPAKFAVTAEGMPAGVTPSYSWTIGGQPAGSGVSIDANTNRNPGAYLVEVSTPVAGLKEPAYGYSTLTVLPRRNMKLAIAGPDGAIFPGDKIHYGVSNDAGDLPVTYVWKLDGQRVATGVGFDPDTAKLSPGTHQIEVSSEAPGFNPATATSILTVQKPEPPQLRISAASEANAGDRVVIMAEARPGAGGGSVSPVRLTASDGTITPNRELDTATVQFDPSNFGEQRKTVTITGSVSDDKGQTSTASTHVTVIRRARPVATRLPDIVFPKNGSRVNNCGKRVLLEEVKAYLDRDPTGKVVLVGHYDKGEVKTLDDRRILNSAAVLTAGQGICLGINPAQVFVALGGASQGSEPMPFFCGTSAEEQTRERKGQIIKANDKRAQYRRVEVWFVPTGSAMPPGIKATSASSLPLKKLGCPR